MLLSGFSDTVMRCAHTEGGWLCICHGIRGSRRHCKDVMILYHQKHLRAGPGETPGEIPGQMTHGSASERLRGEHSTQKQRSSGSVAGT